MIRTNLLSDSFGRVMRDLRISVTDRCNFRCLYCLPETEEAANFYRHQFHPVKNPTPLKAGFPAWKPRAEILSYEEMERVVRVAVGLGIDKIRITGGEPLLRRGMVDLIRQLSRISGIRDLAMTTNGFLFAAQAAALREAGLQRVSFSLDSLDRENFRKITGRDGLKEVLAGIEEAQRVGLTPVKVNAVIIRGLNDHELIDLVEFGREQGVSIRFIEFMPLDSGRSWLKDMVVSGREMLERIRAVYELKPLAGDNPAETSRRWAVGDGRSEMGIIAPVTEPFCGHCNRIRLTADGKVRTCLFSVGEHDLKPFLRGGATNQELEEQLRGIVWQKEERHHIGESGFVQPERTMSCIGG